MAAYLLLEDGSKVLLEDGSKILLERSGHGICIEYDRNRSHKIAVDHDIAADEAS